MNMQNKYDLSNHVPSYVLEKDTRCVEMEWQVRDYRKGPMGGCRSHLCWNLYFDYITRGSEGTKTGHDIGKC